MSAKKRTRRSRPAKAVQQVVMDAPVPMARVWIERNARGISYGVQDVGRQLPALRRRVEAEFVRLTEFVRAHESPPDEEAVGGTD
jgi:hypothetical protein